MWANIPSELIFINSKILDDFLHNNEYAILTITNISAFNIKNANIPNSYSGQYTNIMCKYKYITPILIFAENLDLLHNNALNYLINFHKLNNIAINYVDNIYNFNKIGNYTIISKNNNNIIAHHDKLSIPGALHYINNKDLRKYLNYTDKTDTQYNLQQYERSRSPSRRYECFRFPSWRYECNEKPISNSNPNQNLILNPNPNQNLNPNPTQISIKKPIIQRIVKPLNDVSHTSDFISLNASEQYRYFI